MRVSRRGLDGEQMMNTLNELIEMNKMMVAAESNRIKCSCSWCGCVMPSKPGFSTQNATSHGICSPCYDKAARVKR